MILAKQKYVIASGPNVEQSQMIDVMPLLQLQRQMDMANPSVEAS